MLIYGLYPKYEKLNAVLLPIILKQKADNPGMTLGASTGEAWSGYKTDWDWPLELVDFYRYVLEKHGADMKLTPDVKHVIEAWGNVLHPGSRIRGHNHKNDTNTWTGVYYLTDADITVMQKTISFPAGSFILFPAGENHAVPTVQTGERVSLAFNLR